MKLFKRIATTALAAITLTLSTISTTSAADWKAAYREQLVYMREHKYVYSSTNNPEISYTVYDIDKDGTKELLVRVFNSRADSTFFLYTYSNGKVISLGSKDGFSEIGGYNGNGVLFYYAQMGYEVEDRVTKQGNKLYTTRVFSRYTENYHEPYYMTLISPYDYSYVPY